MDLTYVIEAPAKINLGLEVLRKRPDGYHDINTLFATVDLCDQLTLRLRSDNQITCRIVGNSSLADEPLEKNLCVIAARQLLERTGINQGVEINLTKEIPTGAGLGGGSSDAAAVLTALQTLLDYPLPFTELDTLAADLGSDVPFFLEGGLALGSGRGEVLQPVDLELPWSVLLVNPGIHVSTADAYRALGREAGGEERRQSDLVASLREGLNDPESLQQRLVNDFEEPVFALHPELSRIADQIRNAGAFFVGMSGSGSTMFGLFDERQRAEIGVEEFKDYWARVVAFRSDF